MAGKQGTQDLEQEIEEQTEGPTALEKAQQFIEENREPIIRGACIFLGIAIGFGVSYAIENDIFGSGEETGEVIDLEEMDE